MLTSHVVVDVPELGARLEHAWVLHARFRLLVSVTRGVDGWDEAILLGPHPRRNTGRPLVQIPLGGVLIARAAGAEAELVPGALFAVPHKGATAVRYEREGHAVMALEWDPGSLGARPTSAVDTGRMSALDLARLRAAAAALLAAPRSARAAGAALTEVLAVLRALGLPLDPPPDDPRAWAEPQPAGMEPFVRALDAAWSALASNPQMVDLTAPLGLSVRQTHRLATRFAAHYGFTADGWRELRGRFRMGAAAMLMASPRATTESVARAVGFGAPSALCHAFDAAGLPSPGALRRALVR